MAVDDHGLEVLKKSGEQVTPGDKSDYYIKVMDISGGASGVTNVSGTVELGPDSLAALENITVTVDNSEVNYALEEGGHLESIDTGVDTIHDDLLVVEGKQDEQTAQLTAINANTDGLETLAASTNTKLDDVNAELGDLNAKAPDLSGTWGYAAGTSGTLTLTGAKRVLQITATAIEGAGSLTINGGDTVTLPYGSTDKISSEITIEPKGNLTDPTIIFTDTVAFFVEYVT